MTTKKEVKHLPKEKPAYIRWPKKADGKDGAGYIMVKVYRNPDKPVEK